VKAMDAILVVNAGSSSLKFQVFATGAGGDLDCLVKGQMDGIGTRPRLRAAGPDKKPLIDQSYPVERCRTSLRPPKKPATGCAKPRKSISSRSVTAWFTAGLHTAARCA